MQSTDADTAFRCIVCGDPHSDQVVTDCRDLYLRFPGLFRYVQCRACRLVQLHPVPSNLHEFYRSYPIHSQKTAFFNALRRRMVGGAYAQPPAHPSKICDFGCGDGWYLQFLAAKGHACIGYEPDSGHAQRVSQRINVPMFSDAGELERAHAGTFDLVTMHFVLEHLPDPSGVFHYVSRLVKPGGRWHFVIPSLESLEWRLFGARWHGFDVPRHVSYLNEHHVRDLAAKTDFSVEESQPIGSVTDFAGTLSNVVVGHYSAAAFFAAVPLGVLWSRLVPGACQRYMLRKCDAVH